MLTLSYLPYLSFLRVTTLVYENLGQTLSYSDTYCITIHDIYLNYLSDYNLLFSYRLYLGF